MVRQPRRDPYPSDVTVRDTTSKVVPEFDRKGRISADWKRLYNLQRAKAYNASKVLLSLYRLMIGSCVLSLWISTEVVWICSFNFDSM